MIASVLAAVATLIAQSQDVDKPKTDRSGETAFREILNAVANKVKFHGFILKSYREGGREDFYPEGMVEIWRDGDKYRVEFGDMWGSSNIVVCDGKRVLEDYGSDPVIIRNSSKTWVESSAVLNEHGPASSPWFYFLEGPALLDRLDKDRAITFDRAANSVVWNTSKFGNLSIRHVSESKGLDVWELEFDNMPWQQEMYKLAPEWFDAPNALSRWRQKVVITPAKFPKGVFETKVGKERIVDDQTTKVKGPPRLY